VELAEVGLAAGPQPSTEGAKPGVVLHADVAFLEGSAPAGKCYLEGIGHIPVSTALRLACDAVISPLLHRDGNILDLGRSTYTPSRAQRRALRARDHGCVFCGRTRCVNAHHIHHWTKGGCTDLANLVLLCKRCHRLFHEGGFTMVRQPAGRLRFWDHRGREIIVDAPLTKTAPSDPAAGGPVTLPRARDGGAPIDLHYVVSAITKRRT
jgi:hypothetical protein